MNYKKMRNKKVHMKQKFRDLEIKRLITLSLSQRY